MKGWRGTCGALALVAALAAAAPAQGGGFAEDAGWGVLTIASNVLYMPAKLVYATMGGLTGGIAFAVTGGDVETAEKIWHPSMSGTYVLTPPMMRGTDPIYFAAPVYDQAPTAVGTSDSYQPRGIEEQPLAAAGTR